MKTQKNKWLDIRNARSQRKDLKKQFLLFVEGEQTEVNYFRAFRRTKVIPIKAQNIDLVHEAIGRKTKEDARWGSLATWCVIDVEGAQGEVLQKIVEAIVLGKKHNITVVFSNRAIEVWFYLHAYYSDKPTATIKECEDMVSEALTKIFGRPMTYQKNDPNIFYYLQEQIPTAIMHAERLMRENPDEKPEQNPSTTVHKLVKELVRE